MSTALRYFHTYRMSDGAIVGSMSASHSQPNLLEAAAAGFGVVEHDAPVDYEWDRVVDGRIVDTSDAKFAADLEAKWQRILARYPQLGNAVPPAPLQRQSGTFRFSCSEIWKEFAERAQRGEWSLRAPAETLDGLAGPFVGQGNCLAPIDEAGRLGWYDPTMPAQDGDFVLVKWDSRELEGIYKRGANKPEWLAMYSDANPLAAKLLKACGGEYYLVTNESMLRLGRNKVLGVLRRSEVNGARLYEPVKIPNIAPNAATQPYSAADDGPDTFNPAATGDGYLSVSGAEVDAFGLLQGSLTFNASVADPVSTLANVTLRADWSGGSQSSPAVQPQHTDSRGYAIQLAFDDLPANTAWTMKVGLSGNANVTLRRVNLRAEAILR